MKCMKCVKYRGLAVRIIKLFLFHHQRITGSVLGNELKMFGQSVSGGIDVDENGYQGNDHFLDCQRCVQCFPPVQCLSLSRFLYC